MKVCCSCRVELDVTEFYTSSTTGDGLQRQCKSCKKSSNKSANNIIRCRRYRQLNPETAKKSSKMWRKNNPKYSIEYYHKQEDKQKLYNASAEYIKKRYKLDSDYRIMKKLKSQIWSFLKGKTKNQSTAELLGYTIKDFMQVHGQGEENQQIDHRIPITWFKESTPISIVWHLENLQWLDSTKNKVKGNRYSDPVSDNYIEIVIPYIREDFVDFIKK